MRQSSLFALASLVLLCSVSAVGQEVGGGPAAGQEVPLVGQEGPSVEREATLPPVVLKGEDGGTATGEEWNSGKLRGKTSLILYVDTGKKQAAMPLIKRIDSLNYTADELGTYFIVNTSATKMPKFMIQTMIRQRQKANSRIQYVLDNRQALIREWNFTDRDLNVLVLDSSGNVLHRYAGEVTQPYLDGLFSLIDGAISKK
jgi:predicted transcriptional regulator